MACTSQEVPEPAHPVDSFRPHQYHQPPPKATHSRDRLSGHQNPVEVSLVGPCIDDPPPWSNLVLAAHKPRGKFLPLRCQQQSTLNYNRKVYTAHMGSVPGVPSLGDRGGCPTGPFRTPTTLGHTTKTRSQSSCT